MPTLSCGVVVVHRSAAGPRYLLLRAYRYWDFPKGQVEPSEAPFDAAQREVGEETGVADLTFPWGERYRETPPYRAGKKVARYYVGETSSDRVTLAVSPELGRPEHHEYRWVTASEGRALVGDRVRDILDWAASVVGE